MAYRDITPYTIDLPAAMHEALERERESGEQLLWAGQPEPGRTVRAEWFLFAFAIPWTAFALFWETMAIGMTFVTSHAVGGFGWIFVLFGLPFIAIGFAMLSTPFLALAKARRTVYAITNRRILSITRVRGGQKTHSMVPRSPYDLSRTEVANGSGDLTLAPSPRQSMPPGVDSPLTVLYGIKNVREVEHIIRQTFFPGAAENSQPIQRFGVGTYNGER